jgi:hypothetical protein
LAYATIGGVSRRDLDDFLEESRQRQRNVVFPDTVATDDPLTHFSGGVHPIRRAFSESARGYLGLSS